MEKKAYIVSFEIEATDEKSVYQMVHKIVEDYRTLSFSIVNKTNKEVPGSFGHGASCLNTEYPVRLSQLMMSEDISDRSVISIFDADGRCLAKGNWYEDRILKYSDSYGIAHKPGTGIGITFKLA